VFSCAISGTLLRITKELPQCCNNLRFLSRQTLFTLCFLSRQLSSIDAKIAIQPHRQTIPTTRMAIAFTLIVIKQFIAVVSDQFNYPIVQLIIYSSENQSLIIMVCLRKMVKITLKDEKL
jgi:hypothetical protein